MVVLHARVQLAHLNILRDQHRRVVREVGNRHGHGTGQNIEGTDLPRAVALRAREAVEAVLVPGLVVLQPDVLLLAHQRPRHARHVLDHRPVLQVVVTRLQREATRVLVVLSVVQIHVHGVDPLAAVVIEDDRPVGIGAGRH